ncbi:hypothetical protein DYBT9623_01955 [Dyadobacter sp. CECT 9623]|jgi:hypothetical protein|uniref:Uncharacterized protein n=1 Tax=Dyadobacter linearis TaxID=2823330 RepID=A0ABN7R717_9BACT|nr:MULTISPECIES: DUF6134 family protein [unclassified Dyadobacter]MCE7060476.1 hypothetical protein [Dyadobacter sp. CY343]CAG5069219.1 hypothetical protein DYBT9623_01955 [Dyadobacter sp. CECT 9623]
MKVLSITVFGILFLSGLSAKAQNVYDVIVAGRTIGSLKVFDDKGIDNKETHRIESDFKVMFYKGKYATQTDYVQGKLVSATCSHHVNGDLKEKTLTKSSTKSLYEIMFSGEDAEDKPKMVFNSPISSTITGLYYKEPVNVSEVYSERYGKMCSVKKLSDGKYGVSLPDGKQGIYSYKNGLCQEVKTDLAGFKLRIVLNEKRL